MWEDARNKAGGKWLWALPRARRGDLSTVWLDTVGGTRARRALTTLNPRVYRLPPGRC